MSVTFTEIFDDITRLGKKILSNSYLNEGKIPIIDQGKEFIAGYSNEETGAITDLPVIVFGDHTRILKYVDVPFLLGADGVKVLSCKRSDFNTKYLYYYLCSANIPNTGYNRHFKWLKDLKIEKVSYNEQLEEVRVLDKVVYLIETRKQQLEKLDLLIKSQFIEMFERSSSYPKVPLNDNILEMFIGPFGSSLKNDNFVPMESAYCMVYEQKHAILKTMEVSTRYVNEKKYRELKRFSVHAGDIIVSCRGTIGEVYLIPDDAPLGIMHPSIMKIRLNESAYNSQFFIFALEQYMKSHIKEAVGTSVKMAVTAKALGKECFVLPPLALQEQFAIFVEQVNKLKYTIKQSVEKLEMLKKALMQKYFG